MNIENVESIFLSKIKEALSEINDPSLKITLLKKIANQSIDEALNRTKKNNSLSAKISSMFSGRGKAWAKTIVSENNPVWLSIRHCLTHEMLHSDVTSKKFEECSNLIDLFELTGIAWMRFSSVSNNTLRFHLRTKGSKLEDHIKFYTDSAYIFTSSIENLEGVPHKLGLEPGVFKPQLKKEIIDIKVSKEELSSFGIQTIESLI